MNFIKFAFFLATAKFVVAAADLGPVKITENDTSETVGAEQDSGPRLEEGSKVRRRNIAPTFLDVGNRGMCESCSLDSQCDSGTCSWNYVCYDSEGKGSTGCRCATDSNCQSGRCASNLGCEPLVENGQGCALDNDCESGFCGWDFVCHPLCRDEQNIPFMVTNVRLTEEGGEHYWGYHSDSAEDEMKFLKDIKYCPDAGDLYAYRIYGKLISPDEFKNEVAAFIESSPVYNHVLYNIHGFQNTPYDSFIGAHTFNIGSGTETGYFVIPINWRNLWGLGMVTYDLDRNQSAPPAGKQLAAKLDVFRSSSFESSVMCHSMGNFVLRVMAQNVDEPEQVFRNIFMVAADARMDIFSTAFNPDAPGAPTDTEAVESSSTDATEVTEALDIPLDETRRNGGYAITNLTDHVHVVWNRGDHALAFREPFQLGDGEGYRLGLGKYGDQAEERTTLPYFTSRVTYHDFSQVIEWFGIEHGYQWEPPLVTLYEEAKATVTLSSVNKMIFEQDNLDIE